MDDDELRAEFAVLGRPAVRIQVPDSSVIRRRVRRRRARQAAVGLLACACAAVFAGLIRQAAGAPAPTGGPAQTGPVCVNRDLQVRWLPTARPKGFFIEAPPATYLLALRNTGTAACSLEGWPRLAMTGSRQPRQVSISYGTLSLVYPLGASEQKPRVVEPTRVVLAPGATAVSTVTVALTPAEVGCVRTGWAVTPPALGSSARRAPGSPSWICDGTSIVVSPVYPAGVPITRNYPRPALAAAPAITTNPAPASRAGPAAAPYFVMIDGARTPSTAVVRAWRTGTVTATVQPPPGSGAGGFTGVAGAGDDATFVLAAGTGHSRFYQLSLWRGTAEPLIPLPVPPLARPGTPFAVSADGSRLALALTAAGGTAKIVVVSLVTGSTRSWVSPGPGLVTGLSWAGNTRLTFTWTDTSRAGLRQLGTTGPGTSLLGSRLLIPASVRFGTLRGIGYPLVSPDGAVVFATMTAHAGGTARAAVVEFSAATGNPLRAVTPLTGESGLGTWCGALWADPSGSEALAACGAQGAIRGGRFTGVDLHFPAPNFSAGQDFFAW